MPVLRYRGARGRIVMTVVSDDVRFFHRRTRNIYLIANLFSSNANGKRTSITTRHARSGRYMCTRFDKRPFIDGRQTRVGARLRKIISKYDRNNTARIAMSVGHA